VLGDALALLSAACYAGYSVQLSRSLRGARPPPADLVLGFVGVAAVLALGPLVAALHFSGAEDLRGLGAGFVGAVLAKGLADNVLSGQLWARAVALGGPTLATVALSLTVPLAAASDLLLLRRAPGALLSAGCAATVLGFAASALGEVLGEGGGGGGGDAEAPSDGVGSADVNADAEMGADDNDVVDADNDADNGDADAGAGTYADADANADALEDAGEDAVMDVDADAAVGAGASSGLAVVATTAAASARA
jgi:hypothetical protein